MTNSIIVTGAGGGIGESIARHAGAAGWRVGVLDIDGDAAAAVANDLADGVALQAAVNDPDAVEAVLDAFGTPDALVNNAGIVRFGPLVDQSVDDFRAVLDVNLVGAFVCATACARRMVEAGGGSIVSVTSINGIVPGPNAGAYGASKAAINLLRRPSLASRRRTSPIPSRGSKRWWWSPAALKLVPRPAEVARAVLSSLSVSNRRVRCRGSSRR